MKNVYDWNTNILMLEDKNNNNFNLKFRGYKTIVQGNSATGKSFICYTINQLRQFSKKTSGIDTSNIILIDDENRETLKTSKDKFIIIDNADILLSDEDVEVINRDNGINRYLMFMREPIGIELSPKHYAELALNQENNTTELKYIFGERDWL